MRESITLANSSVKWIAWYQSIAPHPLSSKEERGSCRFLQPVYRKVHRLLFFGAMRPGAFFFILFTPIKFYFYPFDALRPRGGPYFLLLQKVGKDRRKGVSPPCESPDQSGVLDAPLWKPPSPRWRGKFSRTPRRFAAGASVPLGKAASACALATVAAPPPLRFWGLRPLAPQGSQTGTFADHARTRMVPRPVRLLRQRLRKSPGSSCRVSG